MLEEKEVRHLRTCCDDTSQGDVFGHHRFIGVQVNLLKFLVILHRTLLNFCAIHMIVYRIVAGGHSSLTIASYMQARALHAVTCTSELLG